MKKILFIGAIFVTAALLILVVNINSKSALQKEAQVYDNINNILSMAIDDEKMQFLSLAVALSNSRSIQDTLFMRRESMDRRALSETIASFQAHLGKDIYAQVITTEFLVHARSWDSYLSGVALKLDRPDLKEVLRTKKAKAGIEAGLPFGIKASAPIMLENNLLGILEVTTPYDTIVSKMRKYQIELVPLMHKVHIPPEYLKHKHLQMINNNYAVTNNNSNTQLLRELKFFSPEEFESLKQENLLFHDKSYFISYPMADSSGKKLGLFVAIVSKKNFGNFTGKQTSTMKSIFTMGSTKEDIYEFTKNRNENIFANMKKGYIANAKNLVEEKDRLAYEAVAEEKLMAMSKEELVSLMLQRSRKKVITGEIR